MLGSLLFSFVGLCWLLSLSYHPPGYLLRFGFISAVLAVMGAFNYSWAITVAYVARRWSWTPRTCGLAGVVFLVPAAYFAISDSPISWEYVGFFWVHRASQGICAGISLIRNSPTRSSLRNHRDHPLAYSQSRICD